MNHLILIKKCNSIQLAHLYEHIFCDQLHKYFLSNNLFCISDYHLIGKTYYGGIIYIEIEFYSEEAKKLRESIQNFGVSFTKNAVRIAASQIIAELELSFTSCEFKKLRTLLLKIDEDPWYNIDEIQSIDLKSVRRSKKGFYPFKYRAFKSRDFTISILLDEYATAKLRDLHPLFRQLCNMIFANLSAQLPVKYGVFEQESIYMMSKSISVKKPFSYPHNITLDLEDILITSLSIIHTLQKKDAYSGLLKKLQNINYSHNYFESPNLEVNYQDTLFFIGPRQWHEISNYNNVILLLSHAKLRIKLNNKNSETYSLIS